MAKEKLSITHHSGKGSRTEQAAFELEHLAHFHFMELQMYQDLNLLSYYMLICFTFSRFLFLFFFFCLFEFNIYCFIPSTLSWLLYILHFLEAHGHYNMYPDAH